MAVAAVSASPTAFTCPTCKLPMTRQPPAMNHGQCNYCYWAGNLKAWGAKVVILVDKETTD